MQYRRLAHSRRPQNRVPRTLGELLFARQWPGAGAAYCVALATFRTSADATFLAAYLDRYLRLPDLYYDQPAALGRLWLLDAKLGTHQAEQFLAPDGLWQQWIDGPPSKDYNTLDHYRKFIGQLCLFADQRARHCTRQGDT
ncbi:hypothetical protein SAMN05216223_107249 [Actinacidiphila yanglinensis]|uniref:Uncharacterized protein n=1 Tax=Actinacidiphila yanglinensis TaxID=310779 RepID=A0A1H6BVX2_9ACTN|nr:hypothetical protein SAMN05216223_107249 [Actinacidiphila yanglinensis]